MKNAYTILFKNPGRKTQLWNMVVDWIKMLNCVLNEACRGACLREILLAQNMVQRLDLMNEF
jgi:hypothetical protein